MKEATENSNESSHSAHGNWKNEWIALETIRKYKIWDLQEWEFVLQFFG
jgi:hypothetical protein